MFFAASYVGVFWILTGVMFYTLTGFICLGYILQLWFHWRPKLRYI
jgi:hypothetical protein